MFETTPNESGKINKHAKLKLSLATVGLATIMSTVSMPASALFFDLFKWNISTPKAEPTVVAVEADEPPEPPTSLKGKKVPEPANIYTFVKNKEAAIALGKSLFWDQSIGTDGEAACATCHFSAGADNRLDNQLAPAPTADGFHSRRPNETLVKGDFPFVKFSDILKNDSDEQPKRDVRDVVGSQGVFFQQFINAVPGEPQDETELLNDPIFNVNGLNVYQVTRRNAPTVINAVFNLRNFWDGRAQTIFNGVNEFGKRDPKAGVFVTFDGKPKKIAITINDASLASQAVGPIISTIEMSSITRVRPEIGKRVLSRRMLAGQTVSHDDSVLGQYASANGDGLPYTYEDAVKHIFSDRLWNSTDTVWIEGNEYSQMEANFSLFFGLAVQLYEATLVSDETPFDKFAEGDSHAMSDAAQRGFAVFMGDGKCIACHDGALFNGGPERKNKLGKTERLERMIMGNNEQAIYDNHFYNIGVTRTEDDLGVGGTDPFGNPLSFARLAQKGAAEFYWKELDNPNLNVSPSERVAVDGAFKTPTLRNIALTGPYFHSGSYATLRQVVEFYNRGGNFPHNNRYNLDADIEKLELSDQQQDDLVSFLEALTDPRVKNHAAPFDHPSLTVADGFEGDGANAPENPEEPGTVEEIEILIPAVGKNGYQNNVVPSFTERLGADHHARADNPAKSEPLPEPNYKQLEKCGYEGETCNLKKAPKPAIVYYADNLTDLKYKRNYTGLTGITADSIECNNDTFGDPKKGHKKACYYVK